MLSPKPSVIAKDQSSRESGDISTVSPGLDMFARPEVMVELLRETQPYRSEKEIRLSDSRITEELAWILSVEKDDKVDFGHFGRALRLAYHAGFILNNRNGQPNHRQENLLEALQGLGNSFTPTTLLQRLLASCEMPLLLLGLEVQTSRRLAEWPAIVDSLTSIYNGDFDGEGMLASSDLGDFSEVMASMARIMQLAGTVTTGPRLPESVLNQFQWSVRQVLVICAGDGRPFGGDGNRLNGDLVAMLLKLGGDPSDVRLAQHLGLLSDRIEDFTEMLAVEAKRPRSSFHSEWAQVAILRSGWARKRRELAISVSGTQVQVTLHSCGNVILQGPLEFAMEVDGVCVEATGTWVETCWQSDSDADYLEMELEMGAGWRLQRQFCVSRRSGAVLIADVVLGNGVADVRHTMKLVASAAGARFSAGTDGRELLLETKNVHGLVLPVGLSEWRADPGDGILGELTAVDGLELVSSGEKVSALYCPLFFALTPRAAHKQFTWRRLVVGNKLAKESRDQAAAARIQVGGRQWLLYRSLAEQANRTFMGQNYASEFVFGEFLLDGKLKPYVEIA
jgi:hypothetical protein